MATATKSSRSTTPSSSSNGKAVSTVTDAARSAKGRPSPRAPRRRA